MPKTTKAGSSNMWPALSQEQLDFLRPPAVPPVAEEVTDPEPGPEPAPARKTVTRSPRKRA